MTINTLTIAAALANTINGDYENDLGAYLSAEVTTAETGRVVLLVTADNADMDTDGNPTDRTFRFIGGEV